MAEGKRLEALGLNLTDTGCILHPSRYRIKASGWRIYPVGYWLLLGDFACFCRWVVVVGEGRGQELPPGPPEAALEACERFLGGQGAARDLGALSGGKSVAGGGEGS